MDYIHINKLVTTSIYKQIASSITKAIEEGILKYNDKLPTEKEICESFSISNTAVKMAYEKLIEEGKIKRIKGKGTYVTNRKTYSTELHSFYELDVIDFDDFNKYKREIILFERLLDDFSAYKAMNLTSGDRCYQIMYVVKKDQNPIFLQKVYLPKKYYRDFRKKFNKFDKLYEFIENEYKYEIKHLSSTYNAINASSAEALLLNINPDDAIYFVRTKIIDVFNQVVGYVCSYYPGDFTEFEVTVHAY